MAWLFRSQLILVLTALLNLNGCSGTSGSKQDLTIDHPNDDQLVQDKGDGAGDGTVATKAFDPKAGSRLSPLYLRGESASHFAGIFFDKTLQRNCSFLPTEEAGLRCVPVAQVGSADRTEMRVYRDAQCTQTLIPISSLTAIQWATCDIEATKPIMHFRFDLCPDVALGPYSTVVSAVYRLDTRQPLKGASIYRRGGDGSCVAEAANVNRVYYQATRLTMESFVSASSVLRDTPGSLQGRVIEGSDGSRQLLAWYDPRHASHCAYGWATDSTLRCMPNEGWASATSTYADAQCTETLGVRTNPCATPRFARQTEERACGRGQQYRFFALGESTSQGFQKTTSCRPLPPGEYFKVKKSLSPEDFPLGHSAYEGAGRLRRETVSGAGGVSALGLWDRELGGRCAIVRTRDDKLRCVPNAMTTSPFYQDAACTRRMAPLTCPAQDAFLIRVPEQGILPCRTASLLFERGNSLGSTTKMTFYLKSGSNCNAGTLAGKETEWVLLGEEISPSTFVEINEPQI